METGQKDSPGFGDGLPRGWSWALYACFFVSGVAGLIYEVLWEKYLGLFVGGTGLAQIIVLSTFMGGLALGGHFLGRTADRMASPLRFYMALARYLIRRPSGVGPGVSFLYFLNSLGAVVGCVLAGFYLIRTFGLVGAASRAAPRPRSARAAYGVVRQQSGQEYGARLGNKSEGQVVISSCSIVHRDRLAAVVTCATPQLHKKPQPAESAG